LFVFVFERVEGNLVNANLLYSYMLCSCFLLHLGASARNEIGEFVEYDLDNEDEDWLEEFNNERRTLTPEK